MPSPRTTLNGYRPDLGMMLQFDMEMDRLGFIANRVAPVFEAAEQSGTLGIIPLKQLRKEPETGRNSRGNYNRTNYTFEDETYATKEQGLEMPIDDRQSRVYRNWFDFEVMTARLCLDAVLRAYEKRVADAIFNATTFASYTTAVTNEWNDWTNAVPLTDVEGAVRSMWSATGMYPNALIINKRVFRNLRHNAQIIDKIESAGAGSSIEPGRINESILASCFDLRYVIVADSSRDSANEGQDASISSVWSDEYAMVARVAETNDISEPCLARTIHWGQDGSSIGGTIETYYEDQSRGDVVRVRHETQERVMYTPLGYLLSNIIDGTLST